MQISHLDEYALCLMEFSFYGFRDRLLKQLVLCRSIVEFDIQEKAKTQTYMLKEIDISRGKGGIPVSGIRRCLYVIILLQRSPHVEDAFRVRGTGDVTRPTIVLG